MEIKQFGKDHWSLLAYCECSCVDNHGKLDIRRLRINEEKRPIRSNGLGWEPSYGTRQKQGGIPDPNHDDWDCLEELEREGFLEIIGTMINPAVTITERGRIVTTTLRQHKMNGDQFATFELIGV